MVHSYNYVSGIQKALDRLETRIKAYRKYLFELSGGHNPVSDFEEVAITNGEVETIDALVLQLSETLTGRSPKVSEWEPMRLYCSRNETKQDGYAEQTIEYLRWALFWIEKTRTYLTFLSGFHSADHTPDAPNLVALATNSAPGNTTPQVDDKTPQTDTPTTGFGRYLGKLVWTPLPDGRLMELIESFGFIDPSGLKWIVPSRIQVDGASIPQVLWSIVGSPFTGKYRDASVIHDYYCDVRLRHWAAVHRVFYDAIIVSGVSVARAKLMYGAVYYGGPRWSDATRNNNNLRPPEIYLSVNHSQVALNMMKAIEVDGTTVDTFLSSGDIIPPKGKDAKLHLTDLERIIAEYDPTPEEIAAAIDTSTSVFDSMTTKTKSLVLQ